MYLNHWKLKRRPFDDRLDPRDFFAAESHKRVLTRLTGFVGDGQAFAVLAGGEGLGKSAIVNVLSGELDAERHPVVWLRVAPCTALEIACETINQLHHASEGSRKAGTDSAPNISGRLQTVLAHRKTLGQHPVLFVDTADNLSDREVRSLIGILQLSHIEGTTALTTVLVGSCGVLLKARRICEGIDLQIAQCVLEPMTPLETRVYVEQRIRRAGGDPGMFSKGALELMHDLSGGVPRRINRLCDLSLLTGFAQDCQQMAEKHVWIAQAELRLFRPTCTATLPPTHRWRRILSSIQSPGRIAAQ